jgi:hypothetical protein
MVRDSERDFHELPSMYPSSQLKKRTVKFSDDTSVHFGSGDHLASTYPPQLRSRMVTFPKKSSLEHLDAFFSKKNQMLGGFSAHKRFAFETSHAGTCCHTMIINTSNSNFALAPELSEQIDGLKVFE